MLVYRISFSIAGFDAIDMCIIVLIRSYIRVYLQYLNTYMILFLPIDRAFLYL